MAGTIDALRKIPVFSELSEDDLSALAGICHPTHYAQNSIIAHQGYHAENLFALTAGSVGIWVDYETKDADLLAVQEAPCLVGEMSVVDQLPRSATIVTGPPVAGYAIEAEAFKELLKVRGGVALALMKGISRLVRNSNNSFVSELRQRNLELENTNEELRNAHKRLIRQERLSSLGRFSSMIIHDLRNPLSVIKGYADMLDYKLDETQADLKKYTAQIRRETHRLTGLISEWLDYSRPCYTGVIMLDAERMLRVLINLVDNARKACKKGDSVTVSAVENADRLLIVVKDTGRGISEEELNHVFEPFYSSAEGGGTGLGMHIVKTIVEAHEGSVSIASTEGTGTEVTISLPLRM
ncbi:MAG: hypothetical protein CSA76_02050 [Spirochaetales bacterium]|nr:MAG: hypothetical protein CSA76_02050 [Spirochaetales bacterium]